MDLVLPLPKENVVVLRQRLHQNLKDCLARGPYNQTTLGNHLHLSRRQVQHMMTGTIPAEYLPALCDAFGLDSLTDLYLPPNARPDHLLQAPDR